MAKKEMSPKTTALLALEAKMIEKETEVYNLENYIPEMFSQIEKVLKSPQPERLLDSTELKTFQDLVQEHTGGERRLGKDRRMTKEETSDKNRRLEERRWYGLDQSEQSI